MSVAAQLAIHARSAFVTGCCIRWRARAKLSHSVSCCCVIGFEVLFALRYHNEIVCHYEHKDYVYYYRQRRVVAYDECFYFILHCFQY